MSLLLKPLCAAPWSQSKVITIFNFVSINLLAFFIILSCLYLWTIFFTLTNFWILHNTFIFFSWSKLSFYLAECKSFLMFTCLFWEWENTSSGTEEGQRKRKRENHHAGSNLSAQSQTWGVMFRNLRSWHEPISRVGRLMDWATKAPLNANLMSIFYLKE